MERGGNICKKMSKHEMNYLEEIKKCKQVRITFIEMVNCWQVDNDVLNEEDLKTIVIGQGKTLEEALYNFIKKVNYV